MDRERSLLEIWNAMATRVFVKFQSLTGALIVLYTWGQEHVGEAFAYKLDGVWYWGRYVPIGFSRTPIADATTLETLPLTDATEALARVRRS